MVFRRNSNRTYNLNELLGTKLRALYQRSKGRDSFDLDFARQHHELNYDELSSASKNTHDFQLINDLLAEKNFLSIWKKRKTTLVTGDLEALMPPGIEYNQETALKWLRKEVIERI